MSKTLSLKMRDDIFSETEEVIETIHTSRNAYINDALSFYNKFMKRRILKKVLKNESILVSVTSLEALKELELIEDKLPK
jgi:hypothetical protein